MPTDEQPKASTEAGIDLERKVAERTRQLVTENEDLRAQLAECKYAEVGLKHAKEFFELLVSGMTDVCIVLDRAWRFIYVNEVAAKAIRMSADGPCDKILGRTLWEVFPSIIGTEIERQYRRAMELRVAVNIELNYPPRIAWWQSRFFPCGEGLAMLAADITNRMLEKEAAGKARDFYLTLFDTFPALIWRCDVNAKCDYFNRTWLEFTGRSLEQEKGDGWTGGVHPEDMADCMDKFLTAFHARQPFTLEYRLRRHDGRYRWIIDRGQAFNNPAGQFSGYIGSCVDVTERRNAEDAVRQRERDLRLFASATNDTLWECDFATAQVKRSAGFEKHFGYPPEAIGAGLEWWIERIDPADRARVLVRWTPRIGQLGRES